MKQEDIKETLMKIQGVEVEKYLTDDTEEAGVNPKIIIQVVDDAFEYGYWDYFYMTNADNPNWYAEFEEEFNIYLKGLKESAEEAGVEDEEEIYSVIQEIKMFVCFYDSLTDATPYGYWDCLDVEYCCCN